MNSNESRDLKDEDARFREALEGHLDAIRREETPQRLLQLAQELQKALRAQE
jgi:hypothetical protein